MWDVIVIGGLNTDFLGRGKALPRPGETKDGDSFFTGPGGKGANQAVAVARLGGRVAMIGAVGNDDRGRQLVEQIRAEGVNVDHVRRIDNVQTGAAVIHVDAHAEKQILAIMGANRSLTASDVERACAQLQRTKVVLLQLEVQLECVKAAFKWARVVGARTVLDPAPAVRLPNDLLSLVDVIKPNSGEAAVLTGINVTGRDSARKAARKLLASGVGAIAIQAGEEGNLLVSKDDEHWLPRIKVKAVDATGAGDAFAGTLALYLARGRSLIEAATLANAAAALKTTKLGAQTGLPREEDVRALMEKRGEGAGRGKRDEG
jgi:ribokinase